MRCCEVFYGPGSSFGSGKAFRLQLWLRLQVKRSEGSGSGSGQSVVAPEAPAPAPHILALMHWIPLNLIRCRKIQSIKQTVVLCMHFLYFHKINATPDNALQYMTVLQRHGCQKYTGTVPTKNALAWKLLAYHWTGMKIYILWRLHIRLTRFALLVEDLRKNMSNWCILRC